MGVSFIVITENSALCNKEKLASLMQRYAYKVSTFDYIIQYQHGNKNFTTDLLSRSLYYTSLILITVLAKELEEAASMN